MVTHPDSSFSPFGRSLSQIIKVNDLGAIGKLILCSTHNKKFSETDCFEALSPSILQIVFRNGNEMELARSKRITYPTSIIRSPSQSQSTFTRTYCSLC
jgi:hypothetical protein